MVRDVINDPYYQNRREGTSKALLLDQLDTEDDYVVEQGYSKQQRFIDIRPISLYYCQTEQYTALYEPFVGYLALTYHDRFLSKRIDIPVVMQGEGFERNLQLFVFSCVSIACRKYLPDFDFSQFVESHHVADERDVKKMEFQIKEGLEGRVTPLMTAFNPVSFEPLISLLDMEYLQELELSCYVLQTLFTINEDIKFTEFRPSTLTASVILVACYKLHPWMYNQFKKKIFRSGYVQEFEVQECFDELKDHVLVDYAFNTLFEENDPQEEGGYKFAVPERNHPLEFSIEDHEDFIDEFREERLNREHRSEITEDPTEKNLTHSAH